MNSLCWLGEGRELGTVEVNLTSHEPFQREKSHDVQIELHAYNVDVVACVCMYVCTLIVRAFRSRDSGGDGHAVVT